MLSMIALGAASLFAIVAVIRVARGAEALRDVQLAAALAAALAGVMVWNAGGDSRWLVGGLLFLGAGLPGWLAGRRRALTVTALVTGLLALALFVIASARPMAA